MNKKEVSELSRRWKPEKNTVSRIYGCYVNSNKEIISDLDESLGIMPQEEVEQYLSLLKKTLSGSLGKNLIDIVFSTQQVMDSEEHRLLMSLRSSSLKNADARNSFYRKVIDSLDMEESNYLLLMACDTYDVPYRGKSDEVQADASDEVFTYILCCVCPVKDTKPELGYYPGDNEFHTATGQVVSAPELGFLFPAFDNRAANIYNALYYTRKPGELHQEFIDTVFKVEPPISAAEQKEIFQGALSAALEADCNVSVMQAVHEQLTARIAEHKESKDPEPLTVSVKDVTGILQYCSVPEERIQAFQKSWEEQFGSGTVLDPANLIDTGKFEVKTSQATVSVDPESSYLVETRLIDGRRYILIPAEEEVEVNGLPVQLGSEQ